MPGGTALLQNYFCRVTCCNLTEPVDLIVSNPPYVSRPDLRQPRVASMNLAWPSTGEDGLEVGRLLAEARPKLKPGGSLLVKLVPRRDSLFPK
jgi:methylase of polypeptide subunit release factors